MSEVFNRPTAQTVEVVLDKTDGQLEKVLDQRPQAVDFARIFEDAALDFWYMAIVGVQYFKKGELWNARHVQEVILTPLLIKLFELKNDDKYLLLESNKRIEQFLEAKQLESLRKTSSIYQEDPIRQSLLLTFDEFSQICEQIERELGLNYAKDVVDIVRSKLEKLLEN